MRIDNHDLHKMQSLVGDITADNLKYVDCYVSEHLGIFIPSVGFCEYAIRPQHTHPGYSFVLFFSPEQSIVPAQITLHEEHYFCTALSPSVPHEEDQAEDFKRYIAIFIAKDYYNSQYSNYHSEPPEHYIWKQFQIQTDIMLYIKRFMSEYENRLSGYENVLAALTSVITHQIIRNLLDISLPADSITERLDIETAIEYMLQHYGEKLSVRQLARLSNMSESNFIRVFKQETGLAPMEYLINLRIEKAQKLLRSRSKKITDIALQCGFNSSSHFSSCFSKHMGMSPSEYQNVYS